MRCLEFAYVGAMNWAGFVPRDDSTGVRGDRCGFAWSRVEALTNYGLATGAAESVGHRPPCDTLGAVLPFPYAAGAGYVLSAASLRFIATDARVVDWVADAAGEGHEQLQWQKYEDTTTGYFLTFAPAPVHYINVQRWCHNHLCHKQGTLWSRGGGMLRPPTKATLLLHDLKHGSFGYAWELMERGAESYDHQSCLRARAPHPVGREQRPPRSRHPRSPLQHEHLHGLRGKARTLHLQ